MPLHGGGEDAQIASVVPDFRSSLLRPPLFAAKMPLGEEETHESSRCPHGLLCQGKCCVQMVPSVPGASWAASSLTGSRPCSSLHSHLPASGLSLRRKSSWSQEGHYAIALGLPPRAHPGPSGVGPSGPPLITGIGPALVFVKFGWEAGFLLPPWMRKA